MNDADYYRDRAATFRELVMALQRRLCPGGVQNESDYADLLEAHTIRVEAERDAALKRIEELEAGRDAVGKLVTEWRAYADELEEQFERLNEEDEGFTFDEIRYVADRLETELIRRGWRP